MVKIKNIESPKICFSIFLIIHVLVWSLVQLLRNIISLDSMEAVLWGELVSFGTNKHPPLSGWMMAFLYDMTGHCNFMPYLLGQICIIVGFIFIYKLAKFFVSEEKAIASAIILEACYYYSWMIFINSFNCNILLMGLWPAVIYYFYKSIKFNKIFDWVLLGITLGLSVLGKYQIVFLFVPLFLYLLCFERKIFKCKEIYISAIVGLLVILPHVMWLFNNEFFSFAYMMERTRSETHNLPLIFVKLSHLFYPIKFVVGQLIAIASCIGIYLISALKSKSISIKKWSDNKEDSWFLIFAGLGPIVCQGMMGFLTGSRVPSVWGSIMVGIAGLLIFYFFPIRFNQDDFKYFMKWAYASMIISLGVVITYALVQTEYYIAYPHKKVMSDFNKIWADNTQGAKLKYVGGDPGMVFPFEFYNKQHPTMILDTFKHKNPWINHQDVIKSGALIIAQDRDVTIQYTKDLVYMLPNDYVIEPKIYNLEICNKLKNCVNKEFYYVVLPPNIE